MPSFRYEALDTSGRRLTGTMDGGSSGDIIAELNRAGFLPIKAWEARAASGRSLRDMLTPEPKSEDVTSLTLDIVMLLQGGVTLSEALVLLAQMDTRNWRVKVLRELHIGAISYPAFLIFAALSAMVFIFTYVIPQFETALEGFRDKIDPTALMVFNASRFLRTHGQGITIGVGGTVLALVVLGKLGASRGIWLQLVAKLPVARTVFRHEVTVKFCRTLAVLIGNGVDISTALRLLRDVVRLPAYAAEVDGVVADVRKGRRLSEALESRSFLPRHVVQMLRVGEDSGRLPDSAGRVAVFYEARLETALTRAIAVIGPATMILVSILIAWLIISVMTALMSVNDLLK